jgi:hypothetical protein
LVALFNRRCSDVQPTFNTLRLFREKECSEEGERMLLLYSASKKFFMKNSIGLDKMKMFRCPIKVQYS